MLDFRTWTINQWLEVKLLEIISLLGVKAIVK